MMKLRARTPRQPGPPCMHTTPAGLLVNARSSCMSGRACTGALLLQVALRGHVGRARDAAEAARVAISLASDAAADLSSSEGRGPSPPG